jgi:F-type H+-transporting ATPase subunit epsilon
MTVEVVAVERRIWSGEASFVLARTTIGEIGVLPGHEPTLAQLDESALLRIDATDGNTVTAAVHGGFLSITPQRVTVLAEYAEVSEEIDVERARAALNRADRSADVGEAAATRAEVRLKVAGAVD